MEFLNNIKECRKYYPEYASWRDAQNLEAAQRIEYLKQNPNKINPEDIQRGKNLLHAIDVMDEYSQAYAEDMETATDVAKSQTVGLAETIGLSAGFGLTRIKPIQKAITKIAGKGEASFVIGQLFPSVIGMLVGAAAALPVILWATKTQVTASRKGRFEAMNKELKNPAVFATLTPEQTKVIDQEYKNTKLDDKIVKRLVKESSANPLETLKTLKKYYGEDGEYKKQKSEFDNKLKASEKDFNKELTDSQMHKAKRDQQVLSHIVRKIDIASQDYAENTELATNTLTTLAFAGGGLVGWVSNKAIKLLKVQGGGMSKFIPWIIGLTLPLAAGIYSAKLQKQASRIGRFKARQEILNNPESIAYVDKKDSDTMINVKEPEKVKKPNLFKFLAQLIKDNKEYKKYKKTELVENLKKLKAKENIKLSDEQIKDAKTLQMNVFKTFNKVDEKSQTYSESVEAAGEMVAEGFAVFGSLIAIGISALTMIKCLKNPERINNMPKYMAKVLAPFIFVILPLIGIDIYTTKAQKKASRVADMLALKDLENYRNYAGYEDDKSKKDSVTKVEETETNLLKKLQK